jgi:cytochrome c
MKARFFSVSVLCILIVVFLFSCGKRSGKPRVLVFTKTAGYYHTAIPAGASAILKLGAENNFDVDTTSNAAYFTEDSLKNYSAVIFLNTTGNVLDQYQEADFERYIQAGGGFVGVHSATDTEYEWGWYGRLVGAYFAGHPAQQEAVINVVDSSHISTKHLPAKWSRKDEWYNFRNIVSDLNVLLTIDETSYEGGKNGATHPMAWYHDFDGGRAWYTELGHTDESYSDPNYLNHLLGGIQYAIGENKNLNYSKATQQRTPEENRFAKTTLVEGTFFEPTELTVLPNLDIIVTQRRGEIMLYKNETKTVKQIGFLNVYYKTDHTPYVNAEEGLLGIQADPNFAKNHYVYMYYSPIDTSVNRLSRFTVENDSIDLKSEKIILQFYEQREICCHTGGSIAFDKDNNLYLSTGDNSTPFNEFKETYTTNGFGPLDDREGHMQYDARRTSSNTNDLRGKILRIKINPDGTYEIPEGNLFPKGTDKTKPEIYVMGNRNPYRISVDKKNGFVYWGDVGPDASVDSMDTRGPRGYDELNQAKQAGYFGWPLFIGKNYPYREFDYATGKSGAAFDALHPINSSKNNTGLQELPPVAPPFIWYPYGESREFPSVGSGGRTAMAGPVYYTDMFPKETRYPEYFNGKLIFYEWIRGFIKMVTLKPNGDLDKMEPFMPNTKFNSPIDMETGPDGRLYVLEYGSGWFSKNPDAGISRIDYLPGNRPAHINGISVNKKTGALPLNISLSVDAIDPENDKLTYTWDLGKGVKKETNEPKLDYTLTTAGDYNISVEVKDSKGAAVTSNKVNVYAGNETPEVTLQIKGNKTFYFPGQPVEYNVLIEDKDDTAKVKDLADLLITANYVEGSDKAAAKGHQVLSEAVMGKNLMLSLDCKACHKVAEPSIGPSFTDVALKYEKERGASQYLADKIIKGGSGVWGEVAMAAHPDLKESDAKLIVGWVRSLAGTNKVKSLPVSGSLNASLDKPVIDKGVLTISATYTDKGGNNIKPLMGSGSVVLRNSKVLFGGISEMKGFTKSNSAGVEYLTVPKANGSFIISNIDLTGITKVVLGADWTKQPVAGYTFELHLDSEDGKKIGEGSFAGVSGVKADDGKHVNQAISIALTPITDGATHNLVVVAKPSTTAAETQPLSLIYVQFLTK